MNKRTVDKSKKSNIKCEHFYNGGKKMTDEQIINVKDRNGRSE